MARAAVKAKQAQAATAQVPVKPSRKQRKHASGGNPNQDLFFERLRRKQKWVFLALAIVFAVSFTALGVGSGSGGGLEQMYNGIFGGGSDAAAKAQSLIKAGNIQGYKDLANAYITQNNIPGAITALDAYLQKKKDDSNAWAQLAGLKKQQAGTVGQQYQQIRQVIQQQAPGSVVAPGGKLAGIFGTNPIDDHYTQQLNTMLGPLYQQITTGYNDSLTAYQKAAKFAKRADKPSAWLAVSNAAQIIGNKTAELAALQAYVKLDPNTPGLKKFEAACKALGGSCVPKSKQ
jgi:hypothetical protein